MSYAAVENLSISELTELFCDHPTVALASAICDGVAWQGAPSRFQMLAAMFGAPRVSEGYAATAELDPEWVRVAGLGFAAWQREQRAFHSPLRK